MAMVIASENRFDRLLTILETHQRAKDPLSIRIFRWSAKLFKTISDEHANHDKITLVVQEQMKILIGILVNPIDQQPLQKPVKERFCVWEEWMHREYRKLFTFSPLDGGPMIENPPPHDFAQDMLGWVRDLEEFAPKYEISTIQLQENEMLALANYPQFDNQRRMLYQTVAQNALEREKNRQINEEMEWALIEFQTNGNEMQSLSQPVIEQDEAIALAEQHIQQQIAMIQRVHEETLAQLRDQMNWQEKIHAEKIAALKEQLASLDQLSELKRQVEAQDNEYKKVVTSFENKIETEWRYFAEAKAHLENQVANIRMELGRSLSTVASLENQITQFYKDFEAAKADLRVAQLSYQTLQAAMELQNTAYQLTQAEVMRLKKKRGGLGCIIA